MRRLSAALGLAWLVACSPAPVSRTSAIVHGEADWPEELPGVVRLERSGRYCSGTIVATDGSTAWALTAAHCAIDPYDLVYVGHPLETVRIGPVLAEATGLSLGRTLVHPRYELDRHEIDGNVDPWPIGSSWDFALVEIPDGAALVESFAIAPMTAAEDAIAVGTPLRIGGWGISVWPDVTPGERQRGATSVDQIVRTERSGADLLIVDESGDVAGPCFGDSGGPAVVDGPDGPRVAGVASGNVTVVAPCADKATYARVSQAEDFLTAARAGAAIDPASCASCASDVTQPGGACAASGAAAEGAGGFLGCLRQSPWDDCAAFDPAGAATVQAHWDCLGASCAFCPPAIATLARCGVDYDGLGPCADCLLTAGDCCALTSRCQHQPACATCLNRSDAPDGCLADPLFGETIACLRHSCAETCGAFLAYVPSDEPDAGPPDAGAPDAGPDGGEPDAGAPEAGPAVADASVDGVDAGRPETPDETGCSCRVAAGGHPGGLVVLAFGVAWVHRRGHRRRRTGR